MEPIEGLIVEATPSDTRLLAQVRDGFPAHDVSERFRWLAEDVDGTWLLLKTAGRIVGWAVVVWSGVVATL